MKYFYIHGLNATGRTSANLLSKTLEKDVTVLSWNQTKTFKENFNSMLHTLEREKDDIILIGSSMGGFYANALANKLQVPCALFNPVMNPRETLKELKSKDKEHLLDNLSDDVINSYIREKDTVIPRVVVIGLQDTITDPYESIKYWRDKCYLKVLVNAGHEIKNFDDFKKDILELENLFFIDFSEI